MIHVIFQLVIFRQTKQVTILHIYQVTHCSKADIHFCQKFDNFLFSCFEIVLIRRTHTAAQSNAQSLSKARTYGSEMGCTVGRTPGGLTVRRGRGVLGLGGLRLCEGVRGRVRACFTLTLTQNFFSITRTIFFLTIGHNNFGNKIPFIFVLKKIIEKYISWPQAEFTHI